MLANGLPGLDWSCFFFAHRVYEVQQCLQFEAVAMLEGLSSFPFFDSLERIEKLTSLTRHGFSLFFHNAKPFGQKGWVTD